MVEVDSDTRMARMISELERGANDTPTEARFREIVRVALLQGYCPGPTELNSRMGWNGYNQIGGRYTAIRRAELIAHGWVKDEARGRWVRTE